MFKINLSFLKKMNRNTILIAVAVVAILVTGGLIFAKSDKGFSFPQIFGVSSEKIAQKAVDYINNNKLSTTPASLVSFSEISGLVKVKIKIGTSEFDSYVTKDGKLLFPQAFEMEPKTDTTTPAGQDANPSAGLTAEQIIASIKKVDKPVLEAFIVSGCPFGLQMQRILADAIKSVPALSTNIVARYIGSVSGNTIVAMHGTDEAAENLRQICIREEQPTKYWSYVSCYMKKATGTMENGMPLGDSTGCQASTGIDTAKMNACVADTNRGVAFAKADFAIADKLGASGSPTLALNGAVISEFTDDNKPVFGGRTSDAIKTMICDASNTKPSFCSKALNTASAASSFSTTYAAASGAANSATNCAPAQ